MGLPFASPLAPSIGQLAAAAGFSSATAVEWEEPPASPVPAGPPGRRGLAGEALGAVQLGRMLAAAPRLARAPRGDGGPVVDIPGWRAPESSMAPIRRYLRWLGHDARTWGLGTNLGNPQRDAERMAVSVADLAERAERPVALLGWSLGGVIAREVAREIPGLVSQVITYGSPVVGGPNHTIAARNYDPAERARIERLIERIAEEDPLRVPVTTIFSRRDGIVAWSACIDRSTPGVRHVEVRSTHLGLGIDPDVWQVVAETLAGDRR